MPESTPQQVLRQVFSAFDQGDWTIFESHPGLSETRQQLPQMHHAFPDMTHTIEIELVEGEMIACVAHVRGTHQGPFMGLAPTGKQVRFMLVSIDRIVEGHIVEHWAIPDFPSLFQQLGMPLPSLIGAAPSPHTPQDERL